MTEKQYETRQQMLAEYYNTNKPLYINESFEFFLIDKITELNEMLKNTKVLQDRMRILDIY